MARRENVFKRFNGRCAYCGCEIDLQTFHIDHILPKSKIKPGQNIINNYFPACADCNLSKGNLTVEEFRKKLSEDILETHRGRMIQKYYGVRPKKITFFFEENQN